MHFSHAGNSRRAAVDSVADFHLHLFCRLQLLSVDVLLSCLQEEHYQLQVVQITTVLRTLMLTGETSAGMHFRRCVFGNWLSHGDLAIPGNLQSLQIEITSSNIPYGIPVSSGLADRFSTVYLPMQPGDCQRHCVQQRDCFESKIASTKGCFFIFGPTSLTCEQVHKDESQGSPFPMSLVAELCSKNRANCTYLKKRSSPPHLLTGLLRDLNGSFSFKTYINSSGSVFPLKRNQMTLYQGTPPPKTVLAQARTDLNVKVKIRKDETGFRFDLVLAYDPTLAKMLWNSSGFDLSLAAILEDTLVSLRWEDGMAEKPAKPRVGNGTTFAQCDDAFYLHSYQACGGHFDSPVTTIRVDAWAPARSVYGLLSSRAAWLNETRKVEVRLTTVDNLEPLQSLARKSCSMPTCLGGFNECVTAAHCNKKSSCYHSCGQEAYRNCNRLRENGSQFVASISDSYSNGRMDQYARLFACKHLPPP